MANIYLCFVWHMHQPFYKDLVTGEYKLPWTRMHALKDYYGMVKVLEAFPAVHQTFNLVPSMMVQLEEYASGQAADPFLRAALKPAEELTDQEQDFILQYFFQANDERLIARYPRYLELHQSATRARRYLGPGDLRDLQVLSQLAWFDEEFLTHDAEVRALAAKGRGYSREDQDLMGRKQLEIVRAVAPVYKDFAATGQIEISTTPYYHPILPLICDSDIAGVSHPGVPLPTRFSYPEDARYQLRLARRYMYENLGIDTVGLWPSEGSVSDAALALAHDAGFKWFATDNGVLSRTLAKPAGAYETYSPYLWKQDGRELGCIFRDHELSDLIGFVYAKMDPADAARHFLRKIRENCAGRDSLVPIILDGENAWEYYHESGREFLRQLYRGIEESQDMRAVTVSEGLGLAQPRPLDRIFPGSWIGANFDVWIGAEEDNVAWEYLLRARQAYQKHGPNPLAYEELLIAEGSDWCWWYGPEHDCANRPEFDQLFRDHLMNVYLALELPPPEELTRSILRGAVVEHHDPPTDWLTPTLDGEVTSYFEWMGAGRYRVDGRGGAMHSSQVRLKELFFGVNAEHLYIRLDLEDGAEWSNIAMRVRTPAGEWPVEAVKRRVLEASIALAELGVKSGEKIAIQVSLWDRELPLAAVPQQGWLEFSTRHPSDWRE